MSSSGPRADEDEHREEEEEHREEEEEEEVEEDEIAGDGADGDGLGAAMGIDAEGLAGAVGRNHTYGCKLFVRVIDNACVSTCVRVYIVMVRNIRGCLFVCIPRVSGTRATFRGIIAAVGGGGDFLGTRIGELKEARAKATAERKRASTELRREQKKRQKVMNKTKDLSAADVAICLAARVAAEASPASALDSEYVGRGRWPFMDGGEGLESEMPSYR